jgi:cysteine synthase A
MPNKLALQTLNNLAKAYHNTPLVEVAFTYLGKQKIIFAKYEAFNFSGSIKDRIALHILTKAYENNQINSKSIITEATSGNTGIAFASLGKALGHLVRIYMPNWLSKERYDTIKLFGAEVVLVSKEEGGFLGSIAMAREFAKKNNGYCPEQFKNLENVNAHTLFTAKEIITNTNNLGIKLNSFVAGVGTGGTIMGFYQYCLQHNLKINCHPVEPENSPTLTTGGKKIGKHRIQGISDEFIPEILHLKKLSPIISIDDGDAILMAQKLNQKGLSVGISSGCNFLAALKTIIQSDNENHQVATIFCDSALKYLSTDLTKTEPIKPNFLSPKVNISYIKFH